ncbi:MAG: phosphohistidine phosphatase SixA [Proteobacteria bacterium]|nr:phosphohistidine phosphatase SixA [Pseudomonadota bacterium]
MKLYLSLHAEAEPLGPPEHDAARKIVDEGYDDIKRVGEFVTTKGPLKLGTIYHSHTVRARVTAEGFAGHFDASGGVVEADGLGPKDDLTDWIEKFRTSDEDIMICGHRPNLQRIAATLLTGDPTDDPVLYTRAGIACLERNDDGGWGVAWMVNPAMV